MATHAPQLLSAADLLAMPADGKRRWLIRGELWEDDMTVRNRFHSATMANVTGELYVWRVRQPGPRGQLVCGEAGIILPGDPPTVVGVDVAYVPPDVVVRQTESTTLVEGVPTLVVEILSPSTTLEAVDAKLTAYRDAGVPLVWVIDPHDRTVTIYRPGDEPTLVNARQDLPGDPDLPGFRVPVARLFD